MPIKIFFCYAHEDEELLKKLKTHLRPLQREGLIDVWYDRDISAGTEWEREISEQLNAAQIILLLVSPDFMNSDYCYGKEMKRAIEKHERGEALVIPVILRHVYWRGVLGKFQALPKDGLPATDLDWHNIDKALYNVTEGIRKVVDEVKLPPTDLLPLPTKTPVPEQPPIVISPPISTLPCVSFYDKEVDPSGYDEEMDVHPHHKLYPVRLEDTEIKSVLTHGWRIIGASRRGYKNSYQGKYREDDFAIRPFRFQSENRKSYLDMALVAIADGVGSKEYSRYGALAAVNGATELSRWTELLDQGDLESRQSPQEQIGKLAYLLARGTYDEECKEVAYYLLMEALRAAMMSVTWRASQEGLSTDDLQSTLMVFLAAPLDQRRLFMASVQIGDGVLFALRANNSTRLRDRWEWIQRAQIQTSGNEVQPFMRSKPDQWQQFFQCDVLENTMFVMGMTDGTADDIEPPRPTADNPDPDPFFFVDDFYQHIRREVIGQANPAQALDEFLGYQKKQSNDDRTVVCLYNEN